MPTAAELQATLDTAFPEAVNVRITFDGLGEDAEVDFVAPCLIVLDNPLRVWLGSSGNEGKTFEVPAPQQVQTEPFPRFESKDSARVFWFWPRPVTVDQRERLTAMKAGVRETARVYLGAGI